MQQNLFISVISRDPLRHARLIIQIILSSGKQNKPIPQRTASSEHAELSHYGSACRIHHGEPLPSLPFLTQWLPCLPLSSVKYKQTLAKCSSHNPQRPSSSHHFIPSPASSPLIYSFALCFYFTLPPSFPALLYFSSCLPSVCRFPLWEVSVLNHPRDAHCLRPSWITVSCTSLIFSPSSPLWFSFRFPNLYVGHPLLSSPTSFPPLSTLIPVHCPAYLSSPTPLSLSQPIWLLHFSTLCLNYKRCSKSAYFCIKLFYFSLMEWTHRCFLIYTSWRDCTMNLCRCVGG